VPKGFETASIAPLSQATEARSEAKASEARAAEAPYKQEVPGSSPGPPTPRNALHSPGIRERSPSRRSSAGYRHPDRSGVVTIAGKPSETLHPKTWASIIRQAGLDDDQ
jgi:hypothetical protein